jgi:hypothetical protein
MASPPTREANKLAALEELRLRSNQLIVSDGGATSAAPPAETAERFGQTD